MDFEDGTGARVGLRHDLSPTRVLPNTASPKSKILNTTESYYTSVINHVEERPEGKIRLVVVKERARREKEKNKQNLSRVDLALERGSLKNERIR